MTTVALNELLKMLESDREDVRHGAFLALAQLTGSEEGTLLLCQCPPMLKAITETIVQMPPEDSSPVLSTIITALTNIAATAAGAKTLMTYHKKLAPALIKIITKADSCHADIACGLLANMTRETECCSKVLSALTAVDSAAFPKLLAIATNTAYNKNNNNLHRLMFVVENISQLSQGRKLLLDHGRFMIQRLLPFTQYPDSTSRRRAAVSTLHNCCFEKDEHLWLISDKVDMTSHLCLPLAGPDNFTDEESLTLPDQLVYLPDTKTREPCQEIRILLMQALTQLCATRAAREELRNKNVYLILRELHKWEEDMPCLILLEDLVNLLIRTEDEIGADDISSLEVPADVEKKFLDEDKQNEEDEENKKHPIPPPAVTE